MKDEYALGIDFGTSYTKIALRYPDGHIFPLPIGKDRSRSYMPSVVTFVKGKNKPFVGEDALFSGDTELDSGKISSDVQIIKNIKRYIGYDYTENSFQEDQFPPWWNKDDGIVELSWATPIKPEEIVKAILQEALERVKNILGPKGEQKYRVESKNFNIYKIPVRFGCPSKANLGYKKLIKSVLRNLGFAEFKLENICEEPVLASLGHIDDLEVGQCALVYDFGGGTFDTSVIKVISNKKSREIVVYATGGLPFCGGSDIDRNLYRYVISKIQPESEKDLTPPERERLLQNIEQAKINLSKENEVSVSLPTKLHKKNNNKPAYQLTKKQLEDVIGNLFKDGYKGPSVEFKGYPIIEATTEAALRTWRKARMFVRFAKTPQGKFVDIVEELLTIYLNNDTHQDKKDKMVQLLLGYSECELPQDFYLNYYKKGYSMDFNSIYFIDPVTHIGNKDFNEKISKILLVGGVSMMPVTKKLLSQIWPEDKNLPIADELTAVSTGAASNVKPVWSNARSLPYSIRIGKTGDYIYEAFTPIVNYITPRHGVITYEKEFTGDKENTIVLEDEEGAVCYQYKFDNYAIDPKYKLQIDDVGQITIISKNSLRYDLPNDHLANWANRVLTTPNTAKAKTDIIQDRIQRAELSPYGLSDPVN